MNTQEEDYDTDMMASEEENKTTLFKELEQELETKGFTVEKQDRTRPWGGFFCNK